MRLVDKPADMDALVGTALGTSDWLTVTQTMIDKFAEATGDHQWIHVDVERAAKEMPGGKTIAHGYLTLSLLPQMIAGIYRIEHRSRSLNYGSNRVRFTAPVPAGARIRAQAVLKAAEPVTGGRRLTTEVTVEVEGSDRPALVAEVLTMTFDAAA
jgi:acyl dehydratase